VFCVVVEGDDPAPVFCALVLFRSQWGKEKESITSDKIFAVVDTDRESDPLSCSFLKIPVPNRDPGRSSKCPA